jgi:hypothetical protein
MGNMGTDGTFRWEYIRDDAEPPSHSLTPIALQESASIHCSTQGLSAVDG